MVEYTTNYISLKKTNEIKVSPMVRLKMPKNKLDEGINNRIFSWGYQNSELHDYNKRTQC